jgi:hypothetical protein
MRQQLHGDVPLDFGQGGVELVQLEDHPSRGEVHVVGERSFHRDRYRKSERRTRQFGFTDFVGFEFADYIDVVRRFSLPASSLRVCFFNC